nr:MAG: hypothetical protein [Porcellio scaber clopovirus]
MEHKIRECCFIRKWLGSGKFSSTVPLLRETSNEMLSEIKIPYESKFVNIGKVITGSEKDNEIFTVIFNGDIEDKIPMVIIHGFGSLAFDFVDVAEKINEMSKRPIYLLDTIGFNQSSRHDFFKNISPNDDGSGSGSDNSNGGSNGDNMYFIPPAFSKFAPPDFLQNQNLDNKAFKAEMEFIKCIEAWRGALDLKKIILVGHSFGGYLAASYAINYPDKISHLVLAEPWGFVKHPHYFNIYRNLMRLPFNPLFYTRLMSPKIVGKISSPMIRHLYYCNVQNPTGEEAFALMVAGRQYARNSMIDRMHILPEEVPLTFIYGKHSWIDVTPAIDLRNARDNTIIRIVPNAGHIVFEDNLEKFSFWLCNAAVSADANKGKM